jgi:hypothetical protein
MKIDIKRLVSIEWGEPQTDVVPISAQKRGLVLEDSFTPNLKVSGVQKYKSDDIDGIAGVIGGQYDVSFGLTLLNLSIDDVVFFQGGNYYKGVFTSEISEIYKSARCVFLNTDGEQLRWEFPKVRILSTQSGTKGKNGTQGLILACTAIGYNYNISHDYPIRPIGINGKNIGINNITLGI